ncbi:hypothetical protein D9756_003548 [Leucocoprinus leucothites]|uniref:Uncharacterized protein n=1 Tax=Leucocoprinus leucothites TaxID=201217 RepID=A0A8H5G7C0_9AGAR|nr:hypothetical protein D9756_003548 [Leucoagaricus leucothites]
MSHSANDPLTPADSKPHPRTPQSMTTRAMVGARDSVRGPEWGHYIRCAIFFVLEGLYIGLAAVLLKQPLPLPDHIPHFPISSLKSGVTTVSILWHTTAGFFGSDVLADSFSREWSVNPKAPADRVSTITSGILDRFYHIFSSVSTKTFKFTFCAWVLMFALLRVGPSTIIVLNGFDVRPISIGGLVLGSSDTSHDVLKVEQLLGINTGYDTQPNVIIPKPASDDLSQSGSIEYNSDLVCRDRKPLPSLVCITSALYRYII